MELFEIRDILNATVLCGEEYLDREVRSACASDFMSDVLAYVKDQAVLLTGMVNPQVVRTAEMMDMKCIIFVRGKMPGEDILELARGGKSWSCAPKCACLWPAACCTAEDWRGSEHGRSEAEL